MGERAVAGRPRALDATAEMERIRRLDDPAAMLRAYAELEVRLRAEGGTLAAAGVSAVLGAIVAAADAQRGRALGADDAATPADGAEEHRRAMAALDAAYMARCEAEDRITRRWRFRVRRWLFGDVRADLALPVELRPERPPDFPRRGRWPEAAGAVLALVAVWSSWPARDRPAAAAHIAAPVQSDP